MIPVTVKRSLWCRGYGPEVSGLLVNRAKMCCLGFVAREAGIEEDELAEASSPEDLRDLPRMKMAESFPRLFSGEDVLTNSDSCWSAIDINDDREITEEHREAQLIKLGKSKLGIAFTFVD